MPKVGTRLPEHRGYFVEQWIGRWSMLAFWPTYASAERHRKRVIRNGEWRGRVPRIVPA
jgi:hypothetical protein